MISPERKMIYQTLGHTGLEVSKLCYGGLTLGPLQANLTPERAGELIDYAYQKGVNFLDTADLYDNYPHIANGLKRVGAHNLVIASKSYAYDTKGAIESVEKALRMLGRDYIDIWLMHEQESEWTIKGHFEALETYHKLKAQGKIRAIGLSTHYVQGVEAALKFPEIEVIHPIFNVAGVGIQGGTVQEMGAAIEAAHASGKGIYGMKILGGGHLLKQKTAAFDFALSKPYFDSFALGMQSEDEIDYNVLRLTGAPIGEDLEARLAKRTKRICIDPWCTRCQACVYGCQHGAMSYNTLLDKMTVDQTKCVLCGYCAKKCPDFCIKII